MKKLENLKALYQDMVFKKERSTIFTIDVNQNPFSCILLLELEDSYCLLFLTMLSIVPHTIELKIDSSFTAPYQLSQRDYYLLAEYLHLKPDPRNPFRPLNFFLQVDSLSPSYFKEKAPVREVVRAVCRSRNVAEADKIYFCGWRHNAKDESVRQCNFEKTVPIVGIKTAERLRNANISSCWTDDASKENLSEINKYISKK